MNEVIFTWLSILTVLWFILLISIIYIYRLVGSNYIEILKIRASMDHGYKIKMPLKIREDKRAPIKVDITKDMDLEILE